MILSFCQQNNTVIIVCVHYIQQLWEIIEFMKAFKENKI